MPSEMPAFSEIELALATRVGEIAIPLVNSGMDLDEALIKAYREAGDEFIRNGGDEAQIRQAVQKQISSRGFPEGETRPLSEDLHLELTKSFEHFAASDEEGLSRLDEVKVTAKTGFTMFFYPNESQHAGFPHLTAELKDGPVNISICNNPEVIAGKMGLRGEAAALKAVKKHRKALLKQWHATRPDDQKIKPKTGKVPGKNKC